MKKYVNGECVEMTPEEVQQMEQAQKEWEEQEKHRPLTQEEVLTMMLQQNIQTLEVDDNTALRMVSFYPTWESLCAYDNGKGYKAETKGFKFRDGAALWKTAQDNVTFQAQYRPGQGTESLYTHIDEAHAGTQEDPIPAKANMEYEYGKYYSEGDIIYLCKRGGVQNPEEMYGQKVTLQYLPSALIGQYFVTTE